jgi:hypothetical protein
MKTHDRYAVERGGEWMLPRRHYGNHWTSRSQNARLFIRRGDAEAAAQQYDGKVVPISVAAQ